MIGVLVGESKIIRTDEWAVNTSMAFSQKYNDYGYFTNIIRGTDTDVFIIYGQPVKDIGIIYRIFQLGYLLFGTTKGLSFFWCARFIVLFLVSFEFMMLLTKKQRGLAFIGTILIAFAPVISWWFAINGLVEMLISGMLAIILLNKYMLSKNYKSRLLYLLGIMICAGTYLLTFYPSWMIPFAYVFGALAIWIIIENWKKCKISKKDIFTIIAILLLFIVSIIYIFTKSLDTIKLVLNTSYPGGRIETGGKALNKYFSYAINPFFWGKDAIQKIENGTLITSNVCEEAVFFDLFPIGLITTFIVLFKQKNKDKFLIISLIVYCILGVWCIVGFPTIFAKLSLLSNSQASRTIIAVGFLNILILIRSLALIKKPLNRILSLLTALVLAIIVITININAYPEYIGKLMCITIFIMLSMSFYFILRYRFKYNRFILATILLTIILFSGATINPIRKGTNVIYDSSLIKKIEEISKDDDKLWIVEGQGLPYINIPILAGAKTINSTNVYPVLDRWNLLDTNNKNEEIYNRYAHIIINLTDEASKEFKLTSTDEFVLNLNIDELLALDVKYVLSLRDLDKYSNGKIYLEKIYNNNYKIYKVKEN